MQEAFEENFQIWKVKVQLAQEGSYQALEQIKQHCFGAQKDTQFLSKINFHQILQKASLKVIKKQQSYGNYELYSMVPSFLLIQGTLHLQCINLEGDTQVLVKKKQKGVVRIDKQMLEKQFGASNINLPTKFQLVAVKDCIVLETKFDMLDHIGKGQEISDRQRVILDQYFLLPVKNPQRVTVTEQTKLQEKFYLVKGKACYYTEGKQKVILACYTEGYFNPKQFESQFKLHIFQQSELILFEQQFLKEDLILGIQSKRKQHLLDLQSRYSKLDKKAAGQFQEKLITRYHLPRKVLDKVIYQLDSKNDLISTSSSIKGKCGIRIKKVTKKKIP